MVGLMTKKRFQQYIALQPWLAVAETVSFGPSRDPSGVTHYRFTMDFPFRRFSFSDRPQGRFFQI